MSNVLNRELGLLEFNRRVLAQAEDPNIPLLERLRFLCIVSSNLDEFFEVRVAWLKQNKEQRVKRGQLNVEESKQILADIASTAKALISKQYKILRETLLPTLKDEGIWFLRRREWTKEQQLWVHAYFVRELLPILTPIGLDPSHPFPKLLNKSLNFVVELEGKDAFGRQSNIAIVQAPRILPRMVRLPEHISTSQNTFVFLSSILHAHVHELFLGMEVKGCYQFRVTRDTDLAVDEEDIKNLRIAIEDELHDRQYGQAVRLEVADTCPAYMQEFLLKQFGLSEQDLYCVDGPVNLVRMMSVPDMVNRSDLVFPPFTPSIPAELVNRSIFDAISRSDILLHHPYQSFQPVVDLVQQGAIDPSVIAIKMTVYRTGTDSDLMKALIAAAQAGKQVTVVVELMARFDEEANINWASLLEDAGAHVVYGVFGYKVHAKMLMLVRRENGLLKHYVHLGTGNYNQKTARLYTDFGLLTCDEDIASDVNDIFIQITGLGKAGGLKKLFQSPFTLHNMVIRNIERETQHALSGKKGLIIAKMNALVETQVIEALYKASQAGVKIQLIIRGVCGLRPGVKGLSENISVRSIVGRFLEHPRIYYFYNDAKEDLFISSADWMGRNFFRRIETCTPITNKKVKRRVFYEGLRLFLSDNCNSWEMNSDGTYKKRVARGQKRAAQTLLMQKYTK
ncbi:polyphosphate kinase 1 [Neisseria sp. Ec49-e6-T10]|uniref:polyphosphate kinase 1 n=1 Tax=Neisseria sp. Ec49-e6-T10 TaxID=3140744 RepID=UPI003EB82BFF